MLHPLALSLLITLSCLVPAGAALGQTIYRCGNSYSQSPCPGATSLDVSDGRSAAQKSEADAATTAAARAATAMEKERLARERTAPVKKVETSHARGAAGPGTPAEKKAAKKAKPDAPYFVAATPREKPKEKAPKSAEKAAVKAATPPP